jgi:hypothetical protein
MSALKLKRALALPRCRSAALEQVRRPDVLVFELFNAAWCLVCEDPPVLEAGAVWKFV